MKLIQNWREQQIKIAESRGGKLAVLNITDGLLRDDSHPWPTMELLQKLTRSGHEKDFDGEDRQAIRREYGYYSDLQSLRSEDAVTWSVFGTMIYTSLEVRSTYVRDLLGVLAVPSNDESFEIRLWRRVPHPQTGRKPTGPEIDFIIQSQHLLLFGEAKWGSNIGKKQGKKRDQDQLTLRRQFFELQRGLFGQQSSFVLLTVGRDGDLQKKSDIRSKSDTLYLRDTKWSVISEIESHPHFEELKKYLIWKEQFI